MFCKPHCALLVCDISNYHFYHFLRYFVWSINRRSSYVSRNLLTEIRVLHPDSSLSLSLTLLPLLSVHTVCFRVYNLIPQQSIDFIMIVHQSSECYVDFILFSECTALYHNRPY